MSEAVCQIVIDLTESLSDKIVVFKHSSPHHLALDFIRKHSLHQQVFPLLLQQILQSKQKALSQNIVQDLNLPPSPHDPHEVSFDNTEFQNEETFNTTFLNSRMSRRSVFQRLSHIQKPEANDTTRRSACSLRRLDSEGKEKVIDRLYSQSKLKQIQKLKGYEKEREERQRSKLRECTYRPKLGKVTKMLVTSRTNRPIQQHLLESERNRQQILDKMRAKKCSEQLKECSFKPRISTLSRQIISMKDQQNLSRYNQRQVKIIQPKKAEPNPLQSKEIVNEFNQRVQVYSRRHRAELSHLIKQKEAKQLFDQKTGKPLYVPQTFSSSSHRPPNKTISEYLHSKIKKLPQPAKPKFFEAGQLSSLIVEAVRRKRLMDIFQMLDIDKDGKIDSQNINIESLSDALLQVLAPVLIQLQDYHLVLDCEQFSKIVMHLAQTLNPLQKAVLFNNKK